MAFYRPEAYMLPKPTQSAVSLDRRRNIIIDNLFLLWVEKYVVVVTTGLTAFLVIYYAGNCCADHSLILIPIISY